MNRLILTVLLAAGVVACTPPKRVGPPAPVVTLGKAVPELPRVKPAPKPKKPKPVTPPPRKKKVEVYAYRPPASAPDAAAPRSAIPTEKAPRVDTGPRSERATGAPTKEKTSEKVPSRDVTSAQSPSWPKKVSKVPPADVTLTPTPAARVPLPPLPPLRVPNLLPAASTLVKQAERQRRTKDYVGAAATLERAIGLQPREPYIWNRLARVRVEQGLYSQAGNLASRSNALAGRRQVALERDNWIIIATARKAAGDIAGSREAWRHARGG